MASPKILDKDWLRQSFLLTKDTMDELDVVRRKTNKGYHKFSDLTLGGGPAINPLPQFSRYTDPAEDRLVQLGEYQTPSSGTGRWYSENIENNAIYIHIRCGTPAFNSITTFFTSFYNSQASSIARTGKTTDFFYALGQVGGFVVSWLAAPVIWVGTLWNLLQSRPKTKYYYLKPGMPMFWSAVQNIVNSIMVNKGMLLNQQPGEELKGGEYLDVATINKLLPQEFTKNGQFDIFAVSTKYQRRANAMHREIAKRTEASLSTADMGEKEREFLETGNDFMSDRGTYLQEYVSRHLALEVNKPTTPFTEIAVVEKEVITDGGEEGAIGQTSEEVEVGLFDGMVDSLSSYFSSGGMSALREAYIAELNDGGQFISFRVDNPGTVSESFSTSVKDSSIAETINSASQSARDFRFNFADGNLSSNFIAKGIGAVMDAGKSVINGALDTLSMSGVASLFGNALVDIPKYWDSSSANLPKMSYSIKLRPTYGDSLSSVQDMWVQLSALLAMSLPLSTGAQSYTQPFLCEVYSQGRAQSRLCMVDSLSITRGTGNVGWTPGHQPLGIDVDISFVDLSSIMHVPITAGFSPWKKVFTPQGLASLFTSDEGAFSDYLATISGLGLADQIYPIRKMKKEYYLNQANMASWLSPYQRAAWVGGWGPSRVLSGLFAATDRN